MIGVGGSELDTIFFTSPAGDPCNCPNLDTFSGRYTTCKRRFCPRCGNRWAKAWGTVAKVNLEEYGGAVALVSITAPGADVLPWNCDRKHKHSGTRGCRVKQDAGDVWSASAPANWTALRQAARQALKRRGIEPPRILLRGWEPQKRGVPHLHLVLGMGSAEEREAAQAFADELARLAGNYVFGFVDRGRAGDDGERRLQEISAEKASTYLTSYLLGRTAKHKSTIRDNIADPRMPRSLMWMTPTLTRITKVTMRRLRYARWVLAALRGVCSVYPKLEGDDAYEVAKACVALERTKILNSARGPGVDDETALRHGTLSFVRLIRTMRLQGSGPLQPARAAA